jgi:predicted nuclease of predicted toxin-antitoxin system
LKLLIDFNLSPKVIPALADLFPESVHIKTLGFAGETSDEKIWECARDQGFALLTSDRDLWKSRTGLAIRLK